MSKFNSIRDEGVYAQTLEGFGESVGSVDTIGHFTRITFDEAFEWEIPFTGRAWIHAGTYIVQEDSQGFVYVSAFAHDSADDMRQLEERWAAILEESAQFHDEDTEL